MRTLPLVGTWLLVPNLLMSSLLMPAQALAAGPYHVRHASYGCVDPSALSARTSAARAQGGCLRVTPHERWELLSHPGRATVLMRLRPPRAGEPPLYFRSGNVSPLQAGAGIRRNAARHHRGARNEAIQGHPEIMARSIVASSPAAAPLRGLAAGSVVPTVLRPMPATPIRPQEAKPAIARTAPAHAVSGPSVAAPVAATQQRRHRYGVFWPLLAWAMIIVAAALLVRRLLRRKPASAPQEPPGAAPAILDSRGPWLQERIEPQISTHPAEPEPAPRTAPESLAQAAPPAETATAPISVSDYKSRCVARLRHAGWDARTRFTAGMSGPDVIARNNGLVLALQCHPSNDPVDVEEVEGACLARERQRTDLAAIVSNSPFTDAARQLAARTGVVLLHEDELASFAA